MIKFADPLQAESPTGRTHEGSCKPPPVLRACVHVWLVRRELVFFLFFFGLGAEEFCSQVTVDGWSRTASSGRGEKWSRLKSYVLTFG